MARTKKIVKKSEPIKLWFKKLANGNRSIYLLKRQFVEGKDVKQYECLKLHLIPEDTPLSKRQNDEVLQVANQILSERIILHYKGEHGLQANSKKRNANLILYITTIADKHLETTQNKRGLYHNLNSLIFHLKQYKGENIIFKNVDKKFVLGFIDYLRTAKSGIVPSSGISKTLSQNTQNKLFHLLKSTLNKAVRDEIIAGNPCVMIAPAEKPRTEESKKEYLTVQEIKQLISTDCKNDMLKRAFIFCCLTGIRFSDVRKIKFEDIKTDFDGKKVVEFRQQKTSGLMTLKISDEAVKWIPEQESKTDNDFVFILPKNDSANVQLKKWCKDAGITKYVTFHCSRHTSATLFLTLGTPIEVASKLLGHSKISTTQVYAKIVNEAQRSAVDRQNNIFETNF